MPQEANQGSQMGIHVVLNAKIGVVGEYFFTMALAPDPRPAPPSARKDEWPQMDQVLPLGSSSIAPGLSLVIPV